MQHCFIIGKIGEHKDLLFILITVMTGMPDFFLFIWTRMCLISREKAAFHCWLPPNIYGHVTRHHSGPQLLAKKDWARLPVSSFSYFLLIIKVAWETATIIKLKRIRTVSNLTGATGSRGPNSCLFVGQDDNTAGWLREPILATVLEQKSQAVGVSTAPVSDCPSGMGPVRGWFLCLL